MHALLAYVIFKFYINYPNIYMYILAKKNGQIYHMNSTQSQN
jgi:hypothetical protein